MNNFAKAISDSFHVLSRLVVPLYMDDQFGRPQLCGSGFFVLKPGQALLVSAAHVLEEARSNRLYYFVEPQVRRLVNGRITSNRWTGPRDTDLLDIAAVRLEGAGLPPYPRVDKFALSAACMTFAAAPVPTARYGLVGFPASRSRVRHRPAEVRVAPYGHLAESAPLREYAARGLRTNTHLYLVFNRKKSFGLEGQGVSFPKPHGISGAPVFEIYDEGKSHQGESFPIAGVVTTWHPRDASSVVRFVDSIARANQCFRVSRTISLGDDSSESQLECCWSSSERQLYICQSGAARGSFWSTAAAGGPILGAAATSRFR